MVFRSSRLLAALAVACSLAFVPEAVAQEGVMTLPGVVPESAAVGEAWATVRMPTVTVTLRERLRAEGFVK